MGQCLGKQRYNPIVPINYHIEYPRFSVNDSIQIQQGINYLNEYGFSIFSDVISPDEILTNIDLLWTHFENLIPPYRIKRNDATTWDINWPGSSHIGILSDEGFGHSQFMWSIRGNTNVKKIFSQIWETPELLVSFDGAGCFRDWNLNPKWKTTSNWYHCDQNPIEKPNRCSIQGIVSLTDSNQFTGGFVIVPQSHKHFLELKSLPYIYDNERINFVDITITYPLLRQFQPCLVKCKAGDMIVFDSRSIHCNTHAFKTNKKATRKMSNPRLLRIVSYVCMSPTSMIPLEKLDKFREMRKQFVMDRISCRHCPTELNISGGAQMGNRQPLRLSKYQQSLIIGTNIQPEDETAKQLKDM